MEINKSALTKLLKRSKGLELESRVKVDFNQFEYALQKLTFDKENGGMQLPYTMTSTLDVSNQEDVRISIAGKDNIKRYWLTDDLKEVEYSTLTKRRVDKLDLLDYGVRVSLCEEKESDKEIKLGESKNFRYKNRYSVEQGDYRYDFTEVRMADGLSFKKSRALVAPISYELELEYVGEDLPETEDFIQHLTHLLQLVQRSHHLITVPEAKRTLENYQSLTKSESFIAANPITLTTDKLPLKKYAVTLKADGERRFLYLDGDAYLINNRDSVTKTGHKSGKHDGTLIEGEYVGESRLFLAYDLLFADGKDMRKKNLVDRVKLLREILREFKEEEDAVKIMPKEYLIGAEKSEELWNQRQSQPFHVDGLIFTPAEESYPNKGGVWHQLYKWKPIELNSVDFLIRVKRQNGIAVRQRCGDRQCQELTLFMTGYDNGKPYPKEYGSVLVPLAMGNMVAQDPLTGRHSVISDDSIVEFVHDEELGWSPIRVRHDKTALYRTGVQLYGNAEKTVVNIEKSVEQPISIEMIIGKESYYSNINQKYNPNARLAYQNFHNLDVKVELLKQVKGKVHFDMASGKGGDLAKWAGAGFTKVIGIDVDRDNVSYAENLRKKKRKNHPDIDVNFIWGDLSKLIFPDYETGLNDVAKRKLKQLLPEKDQFDSASCFFAIHYFMESERSLRTFLQNLADNVKIGGFFVGTCFDGVKLHGLLKGKNKEISGQMGEDLLWQIERDYGTRKIKTTKPYGLAVQVYVKSIGQKHEEYLVNLDFLTKIIKEYGFELVETKPFSAFSSQFDMTDVEKEFSYLNSAFVYKKTGPTPDKIRNKI